MIDYLPLCAPGPHDDHQDSASAVAEGESCLFREEEFCELHAQHNPILIGERQINGHDVGCWPSLMHHRPYHGLTRDGAFRFGPGRSRLLDCGVRWNRSANLLWCSTIGQWDAREAERWATKLRSDRDFRQHDVVYMAGRRVAAAFGLSDLEMFTWRDVGGQRFVLLPHPSGRSRIWNSRQTLESVRVGVRLALEAGKPAPCSLAEVMQLAERWALPVFSLNPGRIAFESSAHLSPLPIRTDELFAPIVVTKDHDRYYAVDGRTRIRLTCARPGDQIAAVVCRLEGSLLRVV